MPRIDTWTDPTAKLTMQWKILAPWSIPRSYHSANRIYCRLLLHLASVINK